MIQDKDAFVNATVTIVISLLAIVMALMMIIYSQSKNHAKEIDSINNTKVKDFAVFKSDLFEDKHKEIVRPYFKKEINRHEEVDLNVGVHSIHFE